MIEKSRNILISGGAGFIGSNFIKSFLNNNPNQKIINIDLLTYAGDLKNLSEIENHSNYNFVQGNICDRPLIENLFEEYKVDSVIHFAAESHVDNSITSPDSFMQTNIMGTFTLLDVARKNWMHEPFKVKEGYEYNRFHHISTDEVYGSLGETGYFTETTPLAPNSPYSASKASSDMIVRSYFHTYGLNIVTTNCSNNYGPHQHIEKLIPTVIRKALAEENIPIYGDGKNVRDWLFVEDHCQAIEKVFYQGTSGEVYNIGGNEEKNNIEVANSICAILDEIKPRSNGKYSDLITFVKDRPGHDRRYAIDASKIKSELNWIPKHSFETGLKNTVIWYLNHL